MRRAISENSAYSSKNWIDPKDGLLLPASTSHPKANERVGREDCRDNLELVESAASRPPVSIIVTSWTSGW
jgi:hypothetical protein